MVYSTAMGPYRTPGEIRRPPAPARRRDGEELIVHAAIATVGAIGVIAAIAERDLHGGAALAAILVAIGLGGALRAVRG